MRRYEEDDNPNVLKDGQWGRVSLMMRDARDARDARVTDAALHRPGFRVADAGLRDARQEARDAYERDLVNAWRDGGSEGAEGSVCTVQNYAYRDHFGAPGHIRNGVCVPDEEDVTDAMPTRKGMTTDEIARDHQRNMSSIYQAYDTSLCDAWRRKP